MEKSLRFVCVHHTYFETGLLLLLVLLLLLLLPNSLELTKYDKYTTPTISKELCAKERCRPKITVQKVCRRLCSVFVFVNASDTLIFVSFIHCTEIWCCFCSQFVWQCVVSKHFKYLFNVAFTLIRWSHSFCWSFLRVKERNTIKK